VGQKFSFSASALAPEGIWSYTKESLDGGFEKPRYKWEKYFFD
jgi:hypothetical protein